MLGACPRTPLAFTKRLWTLSSYLRVRDEDEDLLVVFQFLLEPDAGLQVQVVGGLVEQQQVRFDEKGPANLDNLISISTIRPTSVLFDVYTVPGERHPHPPTTGELLALLVHHRLRESQAAEQLRGLLLGELGPQLVQSLIHL